jgi:hypothetical protein
LHDKGSGKFKAKRTKENVKTIDGQNDWNSITEGILNAANKTLKSELLRPRKLWITQQVLNFIKERNNYKKKENYRQYQKNKM